MTLNHRRLTAEQTALIEEYRMANRMAMQRYARRIILATTMLAVSIIGALATGIGDILLITVPCAIAQIVYREVSDDV